MPASERPSAETPEPRRADARSNRARILTAARDIFAAQGVDVQMSDVARQAQVSIGTLYRNFPTKEGLVDTLLAQRLRTMCEAAREAAAQAEGPWARLEAFLRAVARVQVGDLSVSQYLGGRIPGSDEARELLDELFDEFSAIVQVAQEGGVLRDDLQSADIRASMICMARSLWGQWPDPEWVQQRFMGIFLDGLRAPARTPLPGVAMQPTSLADIPRGEKATAFKRGRRSWDH